MAGIGFELRKLLSKDSFTGLFQAYAYAGIISAGPWVLSIQAILVIGVLSYAVISPNFLVNQFQVSVTYLMLSSLILTGLIQLAFTRFIADRMFERKLDWVMPNFNGCMLLVTRWSENRAFADSRGTVLINPNEHVDYYETIATRELAPGRVFTVEVTVPAYPELDTQRKSLTAP